MDLKEIKNIFEGSKYFSKILIEDDFEINGLINLWNENDVDISIEFNPDYTDNLEFSAPLTKEEFTNSLYITYINFYIEDEKNINCNFDLDCEPDYLFGHLANIEIDENNDILMSGING